MLSRVSATFRNLSRTCGSMTSFVARRGKRIMRSKRVRTSTLVRTTRRSSMPKASSQSSIRTGTLSGTA